MSKIRKVLPFFISDAFGWLNNMPDAQVPKLVTLQRIAISCYQETKSVVTKKQNIFFVFFRQKDAKRCDLDESILNMIQMIWAILNGFQQQRTALKLKNLAAKKLL